MATTSPPLPTYLSNNNLPISQVIPDLIGILDLPGDPVGLPVIPFTSPANALLGATNMGGLPAFATPSAVTAQTIRLAMAFSQFQPTSTIAGMQLILDYSLTSFAEGAAYIKYSLDGGQTFTTLVELTGNTAETTASVMIPQTQNLSQLIVLCEVPGEAQFVFNVFYCVLNVTLFQLTSLIPPFPGQVQIGDLMTRVAAKLGNRSDIFAPLFTGGPPQCADWIMQAVLDISESNDFEELSTTGPLDVTFTANQNSYLFNFLMNTNPTGGYPDVLTRVRSWFVDANPGGVINSGQETGFQVKYADPAVVEQIAQIPGIPVKYTRVGPNYIVGPMPDNNYPTFMRYQFQHPFSYDPNLIASIPIMLPTDWLEIIVYASAMRGAADLRMMDYTNQYKQMLFGDPEFQRTGVEGKGQPGLIHRKVMQRTRDMSKNERSMKPIVMRSCR